MCIGISGATSMIVCLWVHWCVPRWKPEDNLGASAVVPQVGSCPPAHPPAILPSFLPLWTGSLAARKFTKKARLTGQWAWPSSLILTLHLYAQPLYNVGSVFFAPSIFFFKSPYVFQAALNLQPSASAFRARISGMCYHSQGNALTFWRNEWTSDIYLKDRKAAVSVPSLWSSASVMWPASEATAHLETSLSPRFTFCSWFLQSRHESQVIKSVLLVNKSCSNRRWLTPTLSAAQQLLLEHHHL